MPTPRLHNPAYRRRLHERMVDLQRAGKTNREIAADLGLTDSAVRYIASIHQVDSVTERGGWRHRGDQRARMAYEMWQEGKGFTEISRTLSISRPKAHQIVHRYDWGLRHLKS